MITTSISYRFTQAALLIVFFLSTNAGFAQTDSAAYHYSDFRLPDIDRKALDVDFNLMGNAFQNTTRQAPNWDQKTSRFSNSLTLNYSRFRNTERLQSQQKIRLGQGLYSSKSNANGLRDRYNQLTTDLSINSIHRIYYKPQRFFEYDLVLDAGFVKYSQKNDSPVYSEKFWSFQPSASLPLKIGRGRIEPIDDVFMAKFMADDLLEKGVLSAPLSEKELFDLGRVMADARNRRIFDARRQRIFELTQLDNWFKENELTASKNDMVYFTTLADNWLYAFRGNRQSGKRYALGFEPFVLLSHFRDTDFKTSSVYYSARVFGEYVKERPVNQFWQAGQSISAGIEYWNHPATLVDFDPKYALLIPYADAGVSYGYFPNSRTTLLAGANLRYEYYHANPDSEILFDYHVIQPAVHVNLTYFINYQFRVEASLLGNYSWSSDSTRGSLNGGRVFPASLSDGSSRLNFVSSVRLLYSIF